MGKCYTRHVYSVPWPNSLWHMDGHHSLVGWGFVVHGCIDGFSRLIVYLQCAINNYANNVCHFYFVFFHSMEDSGYLNINNPIHRFVLHYIFTPRINLALSEFKLASNLKPVRTEHNWTPVRMWTNGMAAHNGADITMVEMVQRYYPV